MNVPRCSSACSALVVFLAGAASVAAQEQKISCDAVPRAVRAAFEKAYPKATIKGCAQEVEEDKTAYEIASMEGKTGRDVLYYADGTLIVVEETMAFDKAPDPVQQAVKKKYPKAVILLAEKVMREDTTRYEFRLKNGDRLEQVVFDTSGKEVEHTTGEEEQ
jgi:hypothetical protein